jgi:hypothetical protein
VSVFFLTLRFFDKGSLLAALFVVDRRFIEYLAVCSLGLLFHCYLSNELVKYGVRRHLSTSPCETAPIFPEFLIYVSRKETNCRN